MDFEKYLQNNAKQINKEVEKILKKQLDEAKKIDKKLVILLQALIKCCEGGKRIRGALMVLGYSFGKNISNKEIFKVAAAYEIAHTALLSHDDIIDQSILRRDQSSLYQSLGGNHYGVSQALSLGDYGFFLAYKIISGTSFSDKGKIKSLQVFSKVMMDTVLGEMLDLEKADPKIVMSLKTAKYSISGPLILGAILGGDEKLAKSLGKFGENLGIAFQIQDDILGVFGLEKEMGKSVTSDIEEGKNTLLFIYALKNANKKQQEVLKKLYGRGKIAAQGLEEIRKIFRDTGSLDFARKEAEKYRLEAMKIIPEITKDKEMSKRLEQMGEYLVKRVK